MNVKCKSEFWEHWKYSVLVFLRFYIFDTARCPESSGIIALFHQSRNQWNRKWFSEALIWQAHRSERGKGTRLHVGPLSLFHSPNWQPLRKRWLFHIAVSSHFCCLAISFSRCCPGRTAHPGKIQLSMLLRFPPFHVLLVLISDRFHFVLEPVLENSRISWVCYLKG